MADYHIEDIYQGGYSNLKPNYGLFFGYRSPLSGIGMSTDARTANIVKEASKNLSAGAKTIEINQVFPEVFDSVPKEQMTETRRLAKLLGVDITFHAPIAEPSGFTKEGFTESSREAVERQMFDAIQRSHELKPNGNINVTFHSSAMLPGEIVPSGKTGVDESFVIDTESGGIKRVPLKQRYFHGEEKPDINVEVQKINEDHWSNQITNLGYATERAAEFISQSGFLKLGKDAEEKAGKMITQDEKRAEQVYDIGENYLKDSYRRLKDLFNTAYNYGSEGDRKKLDELNQQISGKVNEINNSPDNAKKITLMQDIIGNGLKSLSDLSPPQIFKPLNDFSKEKTIETFSNLALKSFKEYKENAPIIAIENPPLGGAFSTGEELKELILKTREKFVEKAVKNGLFESEAKQQAEKLIGATWDVGHINMLRKHGYDSDYIVKETEKIAPLVKHVHLSDNFGMEHSELPMGMGNVPIKKIMEKLGKEGYKGKKIIEALNWWQHFSEQGKSPPLGPTMEAFGSPMYSDGVGPYWNQVIGLQQGYSSGYGLMLPQFNYQMFGAGFSQLPSELGGQTMGAQGTRMSNRGME